jgi:hypothetical protein
MIKPTGTQKPAVPVLATYHMNNPERDVMSKNF